MVQRLTIWLEEVSARMISARLTAAEFYFLVKLITKIEWLFDELDMQPNTISKVT